MERVLEMGVEKALKEIEVCQDLTRHTGLADYPHSAFVFHELHLS
jgi:hypothetical protein